jgi:O-antigen/teichoic acid export membrane protein
LTRLNANATDPTRIGGLVLRLVVWIVVPIASVFGVLASPVIHVVYGENWVNVIPFLPWAMAWGALAAAAYTAYMLLLSNQQARRCLVADLCLLAGTGGALLVTLKHGSLVYLASMVAVQGLVLLVLLCWLVNCRALSWVRIIEAFAPPLSMAAVAIILAAAGFHAAGGWPPKTFWPATLWGAIFGLLYLGGLRLFFSRLLTDLVRYLPKHEMLGRLLKLNFK